MKLTPILFVLMPFIMFSQSGKESFEKALNFHLEAVSNRDLGTLQKTLAPDSMMTLILPQEEMRTSAKQFIDYHRDWFKSDNWTFETKILSSDVGQDRGIGIVEAWYREPKRDGVPYYNRMIISYALKLVDGKWYVFKDHASSVEKSTD